MIVMEHWKTIKTNSNYEISDSGRCRRKAAARNAKVGKILKPGVHTRGYRHYTLCHDGKTKRQYAHRTVWENFVGPIPSGLQINHKNGIKSDNRLENLEVVTQSENNLHSYRVLKRQPLLGSRCNKSRLTESDIPLIRKLSLDGLTQTAIASRFGVAHATIGRILRKENWTHVP